MHFANILKVLVLAAGFVAAVPTADGESEVAARSPEPEPETGLLILDATEAAGADSTPVDRLLMKRKCDYNGCKCNSRGKQLTVCGDCTWSDTGEYAVTKKRVTNHIYECSPTGKCCDYGKANDCTKTSGRCIINK